ncbi:MULTISPECIES: DUF535 family protein [Dyella]|uniref:DUF535 domain-containing protein n=2 Tax=Dyella TaxID=231454 RepID=A0A4R0YUH0_9GAMM|nr:MULTISPECIES: DUF535 family protein [Dyella]TBR39337.1 DUF535 domain-containing protein [Dyella terrae]TCI13075.1 DUF535 domain-containing protein [Dyella soli]
MSTSDEHRTDKGMDMEPRWSQGAHACFLVLQTARTWWRYCNASPTRGVRRFASFAWHALRSPQSQLSWLDELDSDASTRLAVAHDPTLLERWHRPFGARGLQRPERQKLLQDHLRFVTNRFPQRLREKVLKGHDLRLASIPLRNGDLAYLHVRKPIESTTGEMALFLLDHEKHVLATCALTLHVDGALIGELRGAWAFMGADAVREFTRESHGNRPKDLLLHVVRALGRHYGWSSLRVASAAAQVTNHHRSPALYDGYWQSHGAVLGEDGCFRLSCQEHRRPDAALPSRRRGARRRKHQFRDDVSRQVMRSFIWAGPDTEGAATARQGNIDTSVAAWLPGLPATAGAR